jgi:bla regulator protein blaR1
MANWSQSQFLQSLGWAIINSFWQIALLWCVYLLVNQFTSLSAHKKYRLAISLLLTGFAWSVLTFAVHFSAGHVSSWAFLEQTIEHNNQWLNVVLIAASMAYLGLLLFPAYRLLQNWKYVQYIKKQGLQKAELTYRLFVQKLAPQIGIAKKVTVHVSGLVSSPLTVGYLKPIILLPLSACTQLTPQQVEAILLHELSHIKRYDYVVNFILSVVHTLLYFNPFVKQLMKVVERERETCCDELVLQYGYDKIGYASALLHLEKSATHSTALALAATGKSAFFQRIEMIVGVERKKLIDRTRWAGVLAALVCILALNSVMIIKEKKEGRGLDSISYIGNPLDWTGSEAFGEEMMQKDIGHPDRADVAMERSNTKPTNNLPQPSAKYTAPQDQALAHPPSDYQFISADDVEQSLSVEQKKKVEEAVITTKKVLKELQWQDVATQIADAMTEQEKARAKKELSKEIEKINWARVEQNMKASYEQLQWEKVNLQLQQAQAALQLDSLQSAYAAQLAALRAAEREIAEAKNACTPLPDASLQELQQLRTDLKGKVEVIKALKNNKKVVRL